MTHQEFDKRLDEMLETLASGWRGWTHDQLDGTSFIKDELDGIEKTKSDAKQAIRELFVEVVGEDKGWDVSKSDYGFKDQGKNELRQELRTTITGKEGGDE